VLGCSLLTGFGLMSSAAHGQQLYAQLPPAAQVPELLPSHEEPLPDQIERLPGVKAELEVIHRRSQLVVARSPIVRTAIADPSVIEIAPYSPNEIGVIGLAMGSTTLTLWFENNPEPLIYLIKVIRDPSLEEQARIDYGKLEKKLALIFPNSKVYLIPLSNKIVVKGQARDSEEATQILNIIRGEVINQYGSLGGVQPVSATGTGVTGGLTRGINPWDVASSNIVNMLMIPGEFQVMLRVRIAELNRSMLRNLGVDFNAIINNGAAAFSSSMGGVPPTLTGIFDNGQVEVLINALHHNGTAKILTEPTLTVLSGHPASVLSGGEFAVPTIVGVQGVGAQQTTFRGFGASLVVTPTVLDKDLIRMFITPEFSQINAANTSANGIPGLDTRRVSTTVQLREGQTIVLAGLLSHQARTDITGIPGLSAIPLIGPTLFSAKRSTQDETELLITVSPELVRPMEPDEVPPVPGFEVTTPDDRLLYLKAMTQGPNDTNVYQLAPYGNRSGTGVPIGYGNFNPAPAAPEYAPVPTNPYGGGFSQPSGAASTPPAAGPAQGRYPVPPVPNQRGALPNDQRGALPNALPPGVAPSNAYPPSGYPPSAYPPSAYPPSSYPQNGYPQNGYPQGTPGNGTAPPAPATRAMPLPQNRYSTPGPTASAAGATSAQMTPDATPRVRTIPQLLQGPRLGRTQQANHTPGSENSANSGNPSGATRAWGSTPANGGR
jgi:pilus assembly protein CpaC